MTDPKLQRQDHLDRGKPTWGVLNRKPLLLWLCCGIFLTYRFERKREVTEDS